MLPERFSFPRTMTFILLFLLVGSRLFPEMVYSIAYAQDTPYSPSQVIEAVNALRMGGWLVPAQRSSGADAGSAAWRLAVTPE
jgi:hypothetical protein